MALQKDDELRNEMILARHNKIVNANLSSMNFDSTGDSFTGSQVERKPVSRRSSLRKVRRDASHPKSILKPSSYGQSSLSKKKKGAKNTSPQF